ncbi:hypothetical protein Acr_16g0001160 [Actinidia rufa]|uniref:Uncharacterized protein n=1 Tax=Actinidia rufa TaxID=165716 RepID=A0A7J0FXR9_9ERIC|nr:hypothetical protein Acr_16g0001160 [Actinidia rufa]
MIDEANQHPSPPPKESSPLERLSEVEVPSSLAMELNIMTQGDLDRLWETCSFPLGVQTRIPGNGETVLSTGDGKCHLSLNEFRCLYALLKGLKSESEWLYFKARPGKNILKGAPSNVMGWKKRFFFVSGDDWEFHLSIPHEEGAVRVLRSWGAPDRRRGHFKILVVLDSKTFHKYFAPGRVEMSLSGRGTTEGDIGGEAEGDIRGRATVSAGDASESSHSKDVPRPEVPSRDDSVEFIGIIGKEMRRILPHVLDLTLLRWSGGKVRDPFLGLAPSSLSSSSDSRLGSPSDSDWSKRINLSQLAKVVAEKTVTASSKKAKKTKTDSGTHVVPVRQPIPVEGGVAKSVPSEALGPHASMMASAAMEEKILDGVILPDDKEKMEKLTFDQVVTKFLHVLGQEALAEVSVKEKKATKEIEARNKEVARLESRVAELEKSQNLAKGRIIAAFKESEDFQEVVVDLAFSYFGDGFNFYKKQLVHQYPNLSINFDNIEMDHDFLAKVEAEVDEKERKEAEDRKEQKD